MLSACVFTSVEIGFSTKMDTKKPKTNNNITIFSFFCQLIYNSAISYFIPPFLLFIFCMTLMVYPLSADVFVSIIYYFRQR